VLSKYEWQLRYLYSEAIKEISLTNKRDWTVAWSDQAIEDYIVESLLVFNPLEFIELISWIQDLDLDDIIEWFEELKDIYINREEIFAWLSDFDKAYYTAYIETTLAMAIIPVKLNKANKLKGKETKTVQELKQLKKDLWFPWIKYVPNVRQKVEWTINHIVQITFKSNWTFTWVHSKKAILNHPNWARIELEDMNVDTFNKPYKAKVYANDVNWDEKMKSWWIPKWTSSMFPDWWNESRIKDEVVYAIKNNKWLSKPWSSWRDANIFRWPSTVEWIEIDFVYIKDTDKLETFYPVIN